MQLKIVKIKNLVENVLIFAFLKYLTYGKRIFENMILFQMLVHIFPNSLKNYISNIHDDRFIIFSVRIPVNVKNQFSEKRVWKKLFEKAPFEYEDIYHS